VVAGKNPLTLNVTGGGERPAAAALLLILDRSERRWRLASPVPRGWCGKVDRAGNAVEGPLAGFVGVEAVEEERVAELVHGHVREAVDVVVGVGLLAVEASIAEKVGAEVTKTKVVLVSGGVGLTELLHERLEPGFISVHTAHQRGEHNEPEKGESQASHLIKNYNNNKHRRRSAQEILFLG